MTMPGFSAEASLQKMVNYRQLRRPSHEFENAIYPAQWPVGVIPGDSINPVSWYGVHPPTYGVVRPNQTDAFGACMNKCITATKDPAACQRGCCQQFTHHSSCVIP